MAPGARKKRAKDLCKGFVKQLRANRQLVMNLRFGERVLDSTPANEFLCSSLVT